MQFLEGNFNWQDQVNSALERFLSSFTSTSQLHQAMRYAVLNGGKRLRPLLVYATGSLFGITPEHLDAPAAAVEMIHAYSLVHDDLPAMDNDDLRRGIPTCHKAFNEATAILAGDALQALAFEILSDTQNGPFSTEQRLKMINTLAKACGSNGMAGGQTLDLEATSRTVDITQLEKIHHLKTGALIRASVQIGALAAFPSPHDAIFSQLDQFAEAIGIAFQIQDDILDIESPTEILGKRQGADEALNKATYPAIAGLGQAKEKVKEYYHLALSKLEVLSEQLPIASLESVANYLISREH